jgi:hypothetical protein
VLAFGATEDVKQSETRLVTRSVRGPPGQGWLIQEAVRLPVVWEPLCPAEAAASGPAKEDPGLISRMCQV